MRTLRREDKEIIHNLSLLGALFGAFVGGFLTLHFYNQAHQKVDAQASAVQTHESLVRLSSNLTDKEASVAQAAMVQLESDLGPTPETHEQQKPFWVNLPKWGLWGLCGGAAVMGGGLGYLSLWGSGWLGSLLTYWLIRRIYSVIRTAAPNCSASRRVMATTGTVCTFQRDQNRLLPTLIKLFMLLTMALSVLAVVVWYLTSL